MVRVLSTQNNNDTVTSDFVIVMFLAIDVSW